MPKSKTAFACDHLIVGMGPLGLAAAYDLARNNNTVLILDKRNKEEVAVRPQALIIDPIIKKQLLNMIMDYDQLNDKDLKFIDDLLVSAEVKVSSVQKFILRRIDALNNYLKRKGEAPRVILDFATLLDQVDLEEGIAIAKKKALLSPLQIIATPNNREEKSAIEDEIKEPQQTLEMQDEKVDISSTLSMDGEQKNETEVIQNDKSKDDASQVIHFKHLIAADGALSPTLDLLHKNSQVKIERKTPSNMQYLSSSYHFGAYITVKSNRTFELTPRDLLSSFLDDKLYFLRLDHKSHIMNNRKSVRLGFVGEIPKSIYKIKDKIERREAAINFAKRAIAQHLKLQESEFEIEITQSNKHNEAKEKVKVLFFDGENLQANSAFEIKNGHCFCLLGDAYFTPNYPVGHGFNDGMEAVTLLTKMPMDNADLKIHMHKYQKLVEKNANDAQSQMTKIRYLRQLPFLGTRLGRNLEEAVETRENENKINVNPHSAKDTIPAYQVIARTVELKILSPLMLIHRGYPRYKIGFISTESSQHPLDITVLTGKSESNAGMPFIIKQIENESVSYYSFVWNITRGYRLRQEADEKYISTLTQYPIDELFTDDFTTIYVETDYPLIEHYTFLSRKEITSTKLKLLAMQDFFRQYPNIVWQFQASIAAEFFKVRALLNKYPNIIDIYGADIFDEVHRAATSFFYTVSQPTMPYSKGTIQDILLYTTQLNIPEVMPYLVSRGATPFLPVSKTNGHTLFFLSMLQPGDKGYSSTYANLTFTLEYLMICAEPHSTLKKAAIENLSLDVVEKLIIQIETEEIFKNLSPKALKLVAKRYQLDKTLNKEPKEKIKLYLLDYLIYEVRPELISAQIKSSSGKNEDLLKIIDTNKDLLVTNGPKYYKLELQRLFDALYYTIYHKKNSEYIHGCCTKLLDFLLEETGSHDALQGRDDKLDNYALNLLNDPRFKDYQEKTVKSLSKQALSLIHDSSHNLDKLINLYYSCKNLNLFKKTSKSSLFGNRSKTSLDNRLMAIQYYISNILAEEPRDKHSYTNKQEEAINEILGFSSSNQEIASSKNHLKVNG